MSSTRISMEEEFCVLKNCVMSLMLLLLLIAPNLLWTFHYSEQQMSCPCSFVKYPLWIHVNIYLNFLRFLLAVSSCSFFLKLFLSCKDVEILLELLSLVMRIHPIPIGYIEQRMMLIFSSKSKIILSDPLEHSRNARMF